MTLLNTLRQIISKNINSSSAADRIRNEISCMKIIPDTNKEIRSFGNGQRLTDDQCSALSLMLEGRDIFLTGSAGTGKTALLKRFIELKKDAVMVTAPTGTAAVNIGGATLHRAFSLPVGVLKHGIEHEQNLNEIFFAGAAKLMHFDTLIIDEISICRQDIFDMICSMIRFVRTRREHHLQLVVCGDFYQLPPVIAGNDGNIYKKEFPANTQGWAFMSPFWKEFDIKTVELKESVRQRDRDFASSLSMIRHGDPEGLSLVNAKRSLNLDKDAVTICGKNATADHHNCFMLNMLPGSASTFIMTSTGSVDKGNQLCCEVILELKKGARVIVLANTFDNSYTNGDTGTVESIGDDVVQVRIDRTGKTVSIGRNTWNVYDYIECVESENTQEVNNGHINAHSSTVPEHKQEVKKKSQKKVLKKVVVGSYTQIPLRLGWAITVHKSQGQTFDRVNLMHREFWAEGQLYVALSRCRGIEGLCYENSIAESQVFCSAMAEHFYLMH